MLDNAEARFYSAKAAKSRAEHAAKQRAEQEQARASAPNQPQKFGTAIGMNHEQTMQNLQERTQKHALKPWRLVPGTPEYQRAKWEAVNPGQEYRPG
jgi:hypothetical protein